MATAISHLLSQGHLSSTYQALQWVEVTPCKWVTVNNNTNRWLLWMGNFCSRNHIWTASTASIFLNNRLIREVQIPYSCITTTAFLLGQITIPTLPHAASNSSIHHHPLRNTRVSSKCVPWSRPIVRAVPQVATMRRWDRWMAAAAQISLTGWSLEAYPGQLMGVSYPLKFLHLPLRIRLTFQSHLWAKSRQPISATCTTQVLAAFKEHLLLFISRKT